MKPSPYIKIITDLIVRTGLKFGGLKAMIASFIIKKLVEYGMKQGEKVVDKIQDNKTIKDQEKNPQDAELDRDLIEGK